MSTLKTRDNAGSVEPRDRATLGELQDYLRLGWPDLPRPTILRWSEDPVLTLDREAPWLYAPIERDPQATRDRRTAVPRAQLRRLKQLAARGAPFQRIAVAHELDPDGLARSLSPTLRDGPRTCTDAVARELVGPLPAHSRLFQATRVLDALVARPARTAAATIELLLDPIIFGVIAPSGPVQGEPCLWYPLAVWR